MSLGHRSPSRIFSLIVPERGGRAPGDFRLVRRRRRLPSVLMASVSAAAAEPYRVVLLASLTSPEPGFMLVRGGGMGNRHEIRSASGLRRKANSYPSKSTQSRTKIFHPRRSAPLRMAVMNPLLSARPRKIRWPDGRDGCSSCSFVLDLPTRRGISFPHGVSSIGPTGGGFNDPGGLAIDVSAREPIFSRKRSGGSCPLEAPRWPTPSVTLTAPGIGDIVDGRWAIRGDRAYGALEPHRPKNPFPWP